VQGWSTAATKPAQVLRVEKLMIQMTKHAYQRYLQSPTWCVTRQRRLATAGYQCEFRPIVGGEHDRDRYPDYGDRCLETINLEVHHLHYGTLGEERDGDLEVLCRFHHLVRGAVGNLDCPRCCDGPMDYDEEDIIRTVEETIREAGGINYVTLEQVQMNCSWVIHCSYCDR
jgi:hypothetical protein